LGGRSLEKLGFKIPAGIIEEIWGISSHPNGMSIVNEGPCKGMTVDYLYKTFPNWFNNKTNDRFPLLIKILDASNNLSIQVHPDDDYALKFENDFGKHEAWYVLDANPNTSIQIRHYASNKDELVKLIKKGDWQRLLNYYPNIIKGNSIDIPPGTLHALCSGSLIFEVQQNSDITYRVFDYDKIDSDGVKRELHLSKAIDVITAPDNLPILNNPPPNLFNEFIILVNNNKFKLSILRKNSSVFILKSEKFLCGYLLNGTLILNSKKKMQMSFSSYRQIINQE